MLHFREIYQTETTSDPLRSLLFEAIENMKKKHTRTEH